MRWVAGEPGQGRKAAALSRKAHAPWGYLAGATEGVTRQMPSVDQGCTATFSFTANCELRIANCGLNGCGAVVVVQSAIRNSQSAID